MGCSSSIQATDSKLVIVGGGLGGSALASMVDSVFDVTLIDKRPVYLHKYGAHQGIVDSKYADQMMLPLKNLLDKGSFIQGSVSAVEFEQQHVTLKDGKTIPFDYLVLATGGRNSFLEPSPEQESTKQAMLKHYEHVKASISRAGHCVIVGGGPVAVELAGAIRDSFSDLKLTIVHSGPGLCHTQQNSATPNGFQQELARTCAGKNINLMLGVRADLSELKIGEQKFYEGKVELKLSNNSTLACDLVLPCIGFELSRLEGVPLDEKGFIKTNPHLQVEGQRNVFALGDCNNSVNTKLGMLAGSTKGRPGPDGESDIVFANLCALVRNRSPPKSVSARAPNAMMVVPVGSSGGSATGIPSILKGFAIRAKGGTYFLSDAQKRFSS